MVFHNALSLDPHYGMYSILGSIFYWMNTYLISIKNYKLVSYADELCISFDIDKLYDFKLIEPIALINELKYFNIIIDYQLSFIARVKKCVLYNKLRIFQSNILDRSLFQSQSLRFGYFLFILLSCLSSKFFLYNILTAESTRAVLLLFL